MRTILISGANSGIGLNIANKLLSEGNKVSLGVRNIEALKGTITVSYTHLTLPTTPYV